MNRIPPGTEHVCSICRTHHLLDYELDAVIAFRKGEVTVNEAFDDPQIRAFMAADMCKGCLDTWLTLSEHLTEPHGGHRDTP